MEAPLANVILAETLGGAGEGVGVVCAGSGTA